jgi:hypothetical protein
MSTTELNVKTPHKKYFKIKKVFLLKEKKTWPRY